MQQFISVDHDVSGCLMAARGVNEIRKALRSAMTRGFLLWTDV
jgi:hypothetical protein